MAAGALPGLGETTAGNAGRVDESYPGKGTYIYPRKESWRYGKEIEGEKEASR